MIVSELSENKLFVTVTHNFDKGDEYHKEFFTDKDTAIVLTRGSFEISPMWEVNGIWEIRKTFLMESKGHSNSFQLQPNHQVKIKCLSNSGCIYELYELGDEIWLKRLYPTEIE